MGRNGRMKFDELKELKKNLENFSKTEFNSFMESCAKELAARLLREVVLKTPVGIYPTSSGKEGGTLRRGWTAGKDTNAKNYAYSLKVQHSGKIYKIEITNPVEYASYVEFGHRTRSGKGWVEGHHMLTVSEQEIQSIAPKILENKIKKFMEGCFK